MTFLKKVTISSKSTQQCLSRGFLAGVCALLVLSMSPSHARAQSGSPAEDKQAEDKNDRSGVRQFDSVTVETVKPGDLPSTVRPGAQTVLRTDSDDLPTPATQDELRKVASHVSAHVVQVVSVQTPPRPYRQVPMVHYGHGLWIAPPEGGEPVLVSPLSWLEEADSVYIMPEKVAKDADAQAQWKTRRRTLGSVTAGARGEEWLEEHRKKLIPVQPHRADRHRNLVTLVVGDNATRPATGLELFDVENKALFRLYGYTPVFGTSLTPATMLPAHPEDTALAFYWQTNYSAILGAPLVSQDGKLVAINTFRHPKKEGRFLAIPTGAIASYLSPDDSTSDDSTPDKNSRNKTSGDKKNSANSE
jgi:hypothetical protein